MPRSLFRYRSLPAIFVAFGCLIGALAYAEDKPSSRLPWTTSRVQGTPEAPDPYRIVQAFPHLRFEKPTSIEEIVGADRLLITEREGKIFSFPKAAEIRQPDLVVDLRELLPAELAGQSVIFHSDGSLIGHHREHHLIFAHKAPRGNGIAMYQTQ